MSKEAPKDLPFAHPIKSQSGRHACCAEHESINSAGNFEMSQKQTEGTLNDAIQFEIDGIWIDGQFPIDRRRFTDRRIGDRRADGERRRWDRRQQDRKKGCFLRTNLLVLLGSLTI